MQADARRRLPAQGAPLSRIERLAVRLYPHRDGVLAAGLGCFLLAALPLVGVARGALALAPWHVAAFAAAVPLVLWAYGLATAASFFHPVHGLEGMLGRRWASGAPWLRRLLRAYATFTVWAFAFAPLLVFLAAAFGRVGGGLFTVVE